MKRVQAGFTQLPVLFLCAGKYVICRCWRYVSVDKFESEMFPVYLLNLKTQSTITVRYQLKIYMVLIHRLCAKIYGFCISLASSNPFFDATTAINSLIIAAAMVPCTICTSSGTETSVEQIIPVNTRETPE